MESVKCKVESYLLRFFLITLCCIFLFSSLSSHAETVVQPKIATTTDCVKTFPISYDKLFNLTLSATNQLNYNLKEIQSKSGYLLFADNNNKVFLASVIYVSSGKSILKIAPCDNVYNFTVTTPTNLFNYINENINSCVEFLKTE